MKEEIKPDSDRLLSERTTIQEAKEAEEKAKKEEEDRIKAENEAKAEEKAKAEKEKYNTGITTRDLARDKNGMIDSFVKFTGKIIQVINGNGYTQYRLAVNDDYDQIILIELSNIKLDSKNLKMTI